MPPHNFQDVKVSKKISDGGEALLAQQITDLESRAVVGQLSDAVQAQIDDFFTNRVVSTRVVVGSIFLALTDNYRIKSNKQVQTKI